MENTARIEFIARLKAMPAEYAQVAIKAFDFIQHNYEITKKETALSVYVEQMPREVSLYRDCKSVEGGSKQGINNRVILINSFLTFVHKPLAEITANDVRAFLYAYQEQRGIKDATLDRYRSYLSSFFKWCVGEEIIQKDPTKPIKPIKYEAERRTSLSQVELEYIRNACKDNREKLIIEMLYSTGCRVSELVNIKLSDIDYNSKTVIVHGKGKKQRECYLNAKALVALNVYINSRQDNNEYLLAGKYGKLTRFTVERIVREIVGRTPLSKKITPHTFRHTTATTALENGMKIEEISTMLGHSDISTTLIYADINVNKIHEQHRRCII